ncbi:efflux RND transporter periplasmic adaptor subunit [Alloacidobacterium dinghuense]|uniref:Efflux RND transporter periplasmic adaptor subunit n=2 Tax=Alloacidobacterium dinghuense TaxID=2763107 RepID=A0A7G8BNY4_9BACT|nr:efflux RND transporter periplasmic adaptor subunit [Alloacidobacterium dinghuense]
MQQQDGIKDSMNQLVEGRAPEQNDHHGHTAQATPPIVVGRDRKLGRGPAIAGILAALLLGVFIAKGIRTRVYTEETLTTTTRRDAVLSVAVTSPVQGAAAQEITLPANTQAFIDTPIYARTSGYLRKWYADIGTHVYAGQLLAEIETPELDQQVQQAQSDLAAAEANQQLAQITADRWTKLLAKNAVSKQETDQATSDLNARQSVLSAAQANVRRLQQLQGFEKVYAPFDGVITARSVDIGALIQAGDINSPKLELFHMASTGKLRLFVPVPEVYANEVHNGDHVAVTSDAIPDAKFTGTIVRNSDAIDISSRTLNVEVDVINAEHKLFPGQYAFIHLPIPPSNSSMTLPSNTLLFRKEGLRVGVVRDGRVQLAPVQIGQDYGAKVEIISGLAPADQVILNPPDSLAQGERVNVEKGDAQ